MRSKGIFTRKELMPRNMKLILAQIVLSFLIISAIAPAAEFDKFRLLSISDSEKLLLVSQIPSKKKFLLDASSVKITSNGKALEFKELKQYSIIQVKMEFRKKDKNGIVLDGIATEIEILEMESVK
jgi:hypothetical protein